jgi:cation diffusion facilitator CzcD-associated flavoprotein CzcO
MSGVPSVPAVIERTDALVNREKHVERPLDDVAIENFRPYKVIVIGAGYSGINCAIRIPEKLRNVELTVYEKNSDVGGTWFENRYPGCACDIPGESLVLAPVCGARTDSHGARGPAHSYQYSYAPNPGWSGFYAPSEEIHAYLRKTCDRFSASRFIKLNHRVEACTWDQSEGKWY